jgi:hypothetical protein
MQKLYKYLLALTAVLIIALGGYVYYVITYDTGLVNINGFVNDHTQKLEADFITSINNICQNLSQKTKIDLIVVMLQNTRPYDTGVYAARLLKNYGDLRPDIDGAIVMLINLDRGTVNLEVMPRIQFMFSLAYGEKILNENIIPILNEANKAAADLVAGGKSRDGANEYIGRAILEGVRAISQKITDEYAKQKFTDEMIKQKKADEDDTRVKWSFSVWFYLGILLFAAVAYAAFRVRSRIRCPKCYYKLKINEETIEVPEKDKPGLTIEVLSCNHCGYYDMKRIVTYERGFYFGHLYEVIKDVIKSYYRKKKREYRKKKYDE